MLFAQLEPISTGTWAAVGGMTVMIIGAVGVQLNNWRKDRRDAELEIQKTRLFERLADSNDKIVEKLAEIKTGQSSVCHFRK